MNFQGRMLKISLAALAAGAIAVTGPMALAASGKSSSVEKDDKGGRVDRDYRVEVGDGEHPAAVIPVRIVEDVELPGGEAGDPGLRPQGAEHGVREAFALVQEGAG